MKILRTPDERFADLPDYPFAPNYHLLKSEIRLHFVDEGPRDRRPVLMMHGEPSWSYLYRFMIPPVVTAGYRVIAPDLIGFGKSDKPAARNDYGYSNQVEWIREWIEALDLRNIVLVCQDWGSLIGLRVVAKIGDRFSAVVLSNGGMPAGDFKMPGAFRLWKGFARYSPWFPIGRMIQVGVKRKMTAAEMAGYDAPFPNDSFKAGTRAYPALVPTAPDDPEALKNKAAWEVYDQWEKPFITCFSDSDPITRGGERAWLERVPGAKDQSHSTLRGGHFIQEDDPDRFAAIVISTCRFVA